MIKEKHPDDTHPEVDPTPPRYFKIGTVISIDDDINIKIGNYPKKHLPLSVLQIRVFQLAGNCKTDVQPSYSCKRHAEN